MGHTLEEARAAQDKAKQLFARNAVGITKVDDGYAVKVNLREPLVDKENVPTAIDGVPIQFEVVGEIRKQPL